MKLTELNESRAGSCSAEFGSTSLALLALLEKVVMDGTNSQNERMKRRKRTY